MYRINSRFKFLLLASWLLVQGCNMPVNRGEVTPVQTQTEPPITLPTEGSTPILPPAGVIAGRVWHDLCASPAEGVPDPIPEGCVLDSGGSVIANGNLEQGEPGIPGLLVSLGHGACPSTGLSSAETGLEGSFEFTGLAAGTYCLMIDPGDPANSQLLKPGAWSSGQAEGELPLVISLDLEAGGSMKSLAFGWDFRDLPAPPVTPTPTIEDTPSATPSPTPGAATPSATSPTSGDDPITTLGNPDWRDSFSSSGNWFSGGSMYEDEHVRFEIENGVMQMTAFEANFREGWVLSWPAPEDYYLEATFKVLQCSSGDRYGLFARASNVDENPHGYLAGLTCDGRFSLRTFDEEFSNIVPWTTNSAIHQGSNQTHRLGLWLEGEMLRIYVDGNRLIEIQDSTFDDGPFGVFIGSAETDDFTVEVEEIAYWSLN